MHRVLLASLLANTATAGDPLPGLTAALEEIARNVSGVYNCSISIAFISEGGESAAAAGVTDFGTGRQAETDDHYAFGSLTKMLTGASVLRLVSEGKFSLEDKVAPLVDPFLAKLAAADPSQGFASMADLWGEENVTETTVQQLLSMTASVPDFDTANPCFTPGCVPKDELRKGFYTDPTHSKSPVELMNVDWVKGNWHKCKSRHPGQTPFCYSSTNFMLLGLLLASDSGASSWSDFDQSSALPAELQDQFRFAATGSPKDNGVVHGYDRTKYNMPDGSVSNHDNIDVAGVFSGWTASDITGSAAAAARLTWAIYGPDHRIAPEPLADQMVPANGSIYGLATHNLGSGGMNFVAQAGDYGAAYGHLGATYGYQSVTAYFPKLDFVLTVASNIETDQQAQPALALCYAYNKAASIILGKDIHCEQTSGSYFGGGCKCDPIVAEEVVV